MLVVALSECRRDDLNKISECLALKNYHHLIITLSSPQSTQLQIQSFVYETPEQRSYLYND